MSETAIASRLMGHAYGLETLKTEFIEIVSSDKPEIDKALDAVVLLTDAIKGFESFIGLVKKEAAHMVPDPKDEVIVGTARIVHRITANKKMDGERWAKDVAANPNLEALETAHVRARNALARAQLPYKLPSTWIEITKAKK